MLSIVYVSAARHPLDREALAALLHQCRRNNLATGLTGMLLYADGNFMGALEGEARAVERVFDRIALDPRHHELRVLLRHTMERRQFPNWSVSLPRGDLPGPMERMFGDDPDIARLVAAQPPHAAPALAFLESFRRTMA